MPRKNDHAPDGIAAPVPENICLANLVNRLLPAGFYTVCEDGFCSWVSVSLGCMSGRRWEEAIGDGWQRAIHPDDLSGLVKRWLSFQAEMHSGKMEISPLLRYRLLRPDGSVLPVAGRVRAVRNDDGTLCCFTGVVFDMSESGAPKSPVVNRSGLSPREAEMARFMCAGLTTKQAAARLGISPRTAESHRARLMKKLNVRSVAELVRFAIKSGLIAE